MQTVQSIATSVIPKERARAVLVVTHWIVVGNAKHNVPVVSTCQTTGAIIVLPHAVFARVQRFAWIAIRTAKFVLQKKSAKDVRQGSFTISANAEFHAHQASTYITKQLV